MISVAPLQINSNYQIKKLHLSKATTLIVWSAYFIKPAPSLKISMCALDVTT